MQKEEPRHDDRRFARQGSQIVRRYAGTCNMHGVPSECMYSVLCMYVSKSHMYVVVSYMCRCFCYNPIILAEPRFSGHQSIFAPGSSMDHVRLW